jgi:hypothetical protein
MIANGHFCWPPTIPTLVRARSRRRPREAELHAENRGGIDRSADLPVAESSTNVDAPNALRVVLDNKTATHTPTLPDVSQPTIPQQLSQSARDTDQRSASTAELDRQLFSRAEVAIEAFRSSFDAALVKGSLVTHQRLRQAASDLMRVAARTTIALDQLSASIKRSYVDKGALPLDERQGARLRPLTPHTRRYGPR